MAMDAQFFKPFIDGTLDVLKTQCSTEAKAGKPFLKGTEVQPYFEIAGIIALSSEKFQGTITLCFTGDVFLHLMGSMLGETFSEITKDLEDGAAELLNIIFGMAKAALNQQGHTIQKAIPTVVRGQALQTAQPKGAKTIVLPFKTIKGDFHVEIASEGSSL